VKGTKKVAKFSETTQTRDKDTKKGEISRRTQKTVNASIQTEFHDTRATKTQTKPILIPNNKE